MNAAFLITFREGLEASLIIGILFAGMRAFGAQKKNFIVWIGVLIGLLLSVLFAWIFSEFAIQFEGRFEKIYEGSLMLVAVLLITHLIFWMQKQGSTITQRLNKKIKQSISSESWIMIGVLAAISVAREGIETVIFFQALLVQSDTTISIFSAFFGVLSSVLLGCIIFFSTKKVPIKKLFRYLSYFLIFIAAGLLGHAIVEFQGAEIIPTFIKPLYDLSPWLSEKEGLGSFLKAAFGYDANPSLLAVIMYWFYLIVVLKFFKKTSILNS